MSQLGGGPGAARKVCSRMVPGVIGGVSGQHKSGVLVSMLTRRYPWQHANPLHIIHSARFQAFGGFHGRGEESVRNVRQRAHLSSFGGTAS
jgi:hypothetical protein